MKIGLRIDVDTLRGTRDGVSALLRVLDAHQIRGTFFFSCGPDNMGRHLWRLLRPSFLVKMLRSNAPSLYGWNILLAGTFWPGASIGQSQKDVFRQTAQAGHEIGVHSWDHHAWQMKVRRSGRKRVHEWTSQAFKLLKNATGKAPVCAASPAWRTTNEVLLDRETYGFQFNSDCRGESVFLPQVKNRVLETPQIPTTLPTYDEIIGTDGITNATYNAHIFSLLRPDQLNVLTIHAEVEGLVCADLFAQFLDEAQSRNNEIVPLGELLPSDLKTLPVARVEKRVVPGREGWISVQGAPL